MTQPVAPPLILPVTLTVAGNTFPLGDLILDPGEESQLPSVLAELLHAAAEAVVEVDLGAPDEEVTRDAVPRG